MSHYLYWIKLQGFINLLVVALSVKASFFMKVRFLTPHFRCVHKQTTCKTDTEDYIQMYACKLKSTFAQIPAAWFKGMSPGGLPPHQRTSEHKRFRVSVTARPLTFDPGRERGEAVLLVGLEFSVNSGAGEQIHSYNEADGNTVTIPAYCQVSL